MNGHRTRAWHCKEGTVLVDTHLHLIDHSRLGYPWLSGEPALTRDFP